jgi:hypothetical protein
MLKKQCNTAERVYHLLSNTSICVQVNGAEQISLQAAKAAATLEPDPTQHSKPTYVWAYIARHVWLFLIRHVCPDF